MHKNHYREIANCIAYALIITGVVMQTVNLMTIRGLHIGERGLRGPSAHTWCLAWLLAVAGGLLLPRRFATGLFAGFCFAMALPTAFNQLIWFLR